MINDGNVRNWEPLPFSEGRLKRHYHYKQHKRRAGKLFFLTKAVRNKLSHHTSTNQIRQRDNWLRDPIPVTKSRKYEDPSDAWDRNRSRTWNPRRDTFHCFNCYLRRVFMVTLPLGVKPGTDCRKTYITDKNTLWPIIMIHCLLLSIMCV